MKNEEQKKKIGLISIISVGVISILCGVATFCGIYFTTKDYRLVKHDYDIYLNKDNIELSKKDYLYDLASENIFTKLTSGYRFNLDALIDDNPSFKSNDYKLSFQYKIKIVNASVESDTNYPGLLFKNKNEDVVKKLPYTTNDFYLLENVNFDDSTDYFDLTFEENKEINWVLDIDAINLKFFAVKK